MKTASKNRKLSVTLLLNLTSCHPTSHFGVLHNNAIDEEWYQRTVAFNHQADHSSSFLLSVPFDIGESRPTEVTATHAIFKEENGVKAAAGVVGAKIDYDGLRKVFEKRMEQGGDGFSCDNESVECYLLDNNGFVVFSEDAHHTGKFFGEVDGSTLQGLVVHSVYKRIHIYDYQAVCLEGASDNESPAVTLLTPIRLISWLLNWAAASLLHCGLLSAWCSEWTSALPVPSKEPEYVYNDYSYYNDAELYDEQMEEEENSPVYDYEEDVSVDEEVEVEVEEEEEDEDDGGQDYVEQEDGQDMTDIVLTMTYIKRTKPKSCDKQVTLYDFDQPDVPVTGVTKKCHESCNRGFTSTLVAHTNLLLVVVDTSCTCHPSPTYVKPTKVEYNPHTEGEKLKTNLYRRQPAPSSYYSTTQDEAGQAEEEGQCSSVRAFLPSCFLLVLICLPLL